MCKCKKVDRCRCKCRFHCYCSSYRPSSRPQLPPKPPRNISNRIYVSNQIPDDVKVIDGPTNTIISTISPLIGAQRKPTSIAANSVTKKVYVTGNYIFTTLLSPYGVFIIDAKTNQITRKFPEVQGTSVAVNETINRIYIWGSTANNSSSRIFVINGNTDNIVAEIGNSPLADKDSTAVNPQINRLYQVIAGEPIPSIGNINVLFVFDGVTNSQIAAIIIPVNNINYFANAILPGITVNELTNKIYITNPFDNTVSVIDGNTYAVLKTIQVSFFPKSIAVNPISNKIYVCNNDDRSISVIDGNTDTVITTISLIPFSFPSDISINPRTNRVYVIASDSRLITIDGSTDTIIDSISVGTISSAITLIP
ncbi:YncE family protein [Priestia aryabhattai]